MLELAPVADPLNSTIGADTRLTRTLPLSVEGLDYRAGGRDLLTGVSFVVRAGSFNIILGPNGAGKSLLLRLCHGLLRPCSGRVAWHGLTPAQARVHHAMVFQHPILLRRTVAANVEYPMAVRHLPRVERRHLLQEALEATNLKHLARSPATRLSGGEQQRVAIARAWVLRPEVLLLDEPTANLDPRSTLAVENLIAAMHQRGTTVIMATHDLAQARRHAGRVLFLNRGRLIEDAPAQRFFARPGSRDAQAFLEGKLLA
ncbi:MAG: ATP-binding cassette domain-containing protein [Rhodanobacter sp.]|nr:MAG: ATP-binding cassette domain-containing protein [Rhodanobacter sp.]TAM40442.1 MAG: ATP-binding cassette domain-containing protein [Rhodanobacter sp.]